MDIEKTIEFLLQQQARFDAQLAQSRFEFEQRQKESADRKSGPKRLTIAR